MFRQVLKGGSVRLTGASQQQAWPVGALYFSDNATDPGTLFGGTWERFGKGKMPISLDEADPTMDAFGETGGSKTVTLGANNLPPHIHGMDHDHATFDTNQAGGHDHPIQVTNAGGASNVAVARGASGVASTAGPIENDGGHTHTVNPPAFTGDTGNGVVNGLNNDPVNNMPPFIAVYIWRRTA